MSDKGKEVPLDSESERSMQEAIDFANELKVPFNGKATRFKVDFDVF